MYITTECMFLAVGGILCLKLHVDMVIKVLLESY